MDASLSPATSGHESGPCYEYVMPDLLTLHAANDPDKPAVIDDRGGGDVRRCTYAELEARSNQLAHVLRDHGVAPGDKVVWCGQNSIGIVEIVNASRKIGSTAVPAQLPALRRGGGVRDRPLRRGAGVRRRCVRRTVRTDPRRDPEGRARAGVRRRRAGPAWWPATRSSTRCRPNRRPRSSGEDAAGATMIYTSGTTGKPKGAYRRHGVEPRRRRRRCSSTSATGPTTSTSRPARSTTPGPAGSWRSAWRWARRSCSSTSSIRRTGCGCSRPTAARRRSRRRRRSG